MITDPISDMLTRIRNASASGKTEVVMPYSNLKYAVAKVLSESSFVGEVKKLESGKFSELSVGIKHEPDGPKIRFLKRISKPGHRVYVKTAELPKVLSGFGLAIVSTPNGIMTNVEARKRRLGGEVICEVY
ncbi:MAG: 30S ribosomal protein S8 [bacterium]